MTACGGVVPEADPHESQGLRPLAADEGFVAAALPPSPLRKAVAAGSTHSLALRIDGSVWAWGANASGQLGNGTQTPFSAQPVQVTGLPAIKAIAAGGTHSLALGVDGKVWAWGLNSSGQLGDGTTTVRPAPVAVTIPGGAVAIAAGNAHSLAVAADGSVYTWGSNASGQLGDGTVVSRSTPVKLLLAGSFKAVSAGQHHSMALGTNGSVWTWGRNTNGQIGNGTTSPSTYQLTPYAVSLSQGATAIAAGGSHSLALLASQQVMGWGYNLYGQLGNGTAVTSQPSPALVVLAVPINAITAGGDFSLAIDSSGAAWAWGRNNSGQLGDGTTAQRTSPVPVPGLTDAMAISAGLFHTLALRPDCPFWAWGANDKGQVGDGTQTVRKTLTQALLVNIYFFDNDTDGYGAEFLSPDESCQALTPDYVENKLDCDDVDPSINPGATEVCDGVDNDCDMLIDEQVGSFYYLDADKDGYGKATDSVQSCVKPAGRVLDSTDCNDADDRVHPGATEVCNTVDDDCDGAINEAVGPLWYRDADGDGYGTSAQSTQACSAPAGYVATGGDCNDNNPNVKPGATEKCNGVDDNCAGGVDEGNPGGGLACSTGALGVCAQGLTSCTSGAIQCVATRGPSTEICDGLDNNCDGRTDETGGQRTFYRDADGDGKGSLSVTIQACSAPAGYVSDSTDCDDGDAGLPRLWIPDADGDGYGTSGFVPSPLPYGCQRPTGSVANALDCNDGSKFAYPGALEVCDGMDNNCNGAVDDGCVAVSCSAWFSATSIPVNGTATFSFSSSGPLADARAYLYGSKNWVQDVNGSPSYDQTTFSYLVGNYPGLAGYYQRNVVFRRSDGADLCTTNNAPITFLP